jgi:hypothetical protein
MVSPHGRKPRAGLQHGFVPRAKAPRRLQDGFAPRAKHPCRVTGRFRPASVAVSRKNRTAKGLVNNKTEGILIVFAPVKILRNTHAPAIKNVNPYRPSHTNRVVYIFILDEVLKIDRAKGKKNILEKQEHSKNPPPVPSQHPKNPV